MFAHEHFKRRLIQLAARHAAAPGFALGLFEELIGNGYGCFHNQSITEVIPEDKDVSRAVTVSPSAL